jgi:cell division protein FtsI (penicillin-binding protein 3)
VLRPTWRIRDLRVVVVGVVFILAWIGIGYRLFQVQVVEAAQFMADGENQRIHVEDIPAKRGTIFDRDGIELAVTVDLPTVVADPSQITDPAGTAEVLAPLVDGDVAQLTQRFDQPESKFAYVARHVDPAVADQVRSAIQDNELDGIYIQNEPYRVYPAGNLAAQLVGFVQQDSQTGLEGLESQYDELLTGVPGTRILERDPDGVPIPLGDLEIEPAIAGYDIRTTIDREIQYVAQQAAANAVADTGAQAATIVVLNPRTGEVLAMASYPTFDPNDRSSIDPNAVRDRAVTDVYEPGSTLKVVTVSAALDQGIVTPQDSWLVPAEYEVDGKSEPYTDVGRTDNRVMSVAEILTNSSNVGTIQIQEKLGNALHYQYLQAFGLGQVAGDSIPGEVPGLLHPVEDWVSATAGASTAIGYRVDVTALQMAAVFGTIANDGIWIQPHVVSEMINPDGSREVTVPSQRPVLRQDTAAEMRALLFAVVDQGTGGRATVAGYRIGGKTGTTEKFLPDEGVYSDQDRIASFIGIAPIDNPQIVVAVVLDSPQGSVEEDGRMVENKFGGVSAAPVFAEVAEKALQALGVPPNGQ